MSAEVQELLPDPAQALRLAEIHAQAFDADARWSAKDFCEISELQHRTVLADADLARSVLVLQLAADEAEILTLAVVPAARGQGLATKLMSCGIGIARKRGVQRLFLEVAMDNAAALALYQRLGFGEAGRRKSYYRRGAGKRVDAVVMSLYL